MANTPTSTDTETAQELGPDAPRRWGGHGRHRRPRPRKLLLTAGGLAFAAGMLSLVRLTPDSGVGGIGTAEAGPYPYPDQAADPGPDRATNTSATISTPPRTAPGPTATSLMGAPSTAPAVSVPLPSGVVSTPLKAPGAPDTPTAEPPTPPDSPGTAPKAPTPPTAPTTPPAPGPTPTPAPSTTAPAPTPTEPGLCMPIIGLCVDLP